MEQENSGSRCGNFSLDKRLRAGSRSPISLSPRALPVYQSAKAHGLEKVLDHVGLLFRAEHIGQLGQQQRVQIGVGDQAMTVDPVAHLVSGAGTLQVQQCHCRAGSGRSRGCAPVTPPKAMAADQA